MRGAYQRENASLVIAALRVLGERGIAAGDDDLKAGLAEVVWHGRLEYLVLERTTRQQLEGGAGREEGAVRYLLDGAHNPDGAKKLAQTLRDEYTCRRLILIWGAMTDKDIAGGLGCMLGLADTLILTKPAGERSAEPEQLWAALPEEGQVKSLLVRDVGAALEEAERLAGSEDLIVVAGSLYLVGAVRKILVGELVDG